MTEPFESEPRPDPLASVYRDVKAKTTGQPTTGPEGVVPEAPPVPAAFGRYRVDRLIGSGGYGSVYLAQDAGLGRPVALKVFPSESADPAAIETFMGEARRLAQLRHSGILSVHDVGIQEGWVYIVSDYLDGPNLDTWLRSNRPSWPESVRMVAHLADALAHAHSRRTVHRDVKPANIILLGGSEPVLVDFGISLDEGKRGASELGVVCGTPAYMSPEQVAGQAHRIDGRTDIYSLGVVLYEMLSGRPPFGSPDLTELLRQVADDDPQPLRQLVPDIPPDLEKVCLRAMAKNQELRYTTAADLAKDLQGILQAAPKPQAARPRTTATLDRRGTKTTPRTREAERRQVTVLVSRIDAFESEEFLEGVDAEKQADLITLFRNICEGAVRRAEGTLLHYSPEGMVACFGYPVGLEDAARRAVSAGLSILEDWRSVAGEERIPRTAIHTGTAVVQAGEDVVSVVGEARNVAMRLLELSVPGQVVCSESSERLIHRYFHTVSLERRKVSGIAEPIEIFSVEDVRPAENPINALPAARLSPLTGRDQELNLLKDRWEQAHEGMGQVVLLIGEAGLGKSRLVHTITQHARGDGSPDSTVIEWRCSPQSQNSDLYPARDYFERLLGFQRGENPVERFERLLAHLESLHLDRKDVVPYLASLLSLPMDDRFSVPAVSPAREREETFKALRHWLRASASRAPVLFIVEDLHWVDASTLELLGQSLAEGLRDRILTLFTFRPEFQTPWPALAHQTSLALNRLTRRQVGDLMRATAGATPPSEEIIRQLHERTGGVPLFVEEYARLLQSSGELPREIPSTLQDLVVSRLDRMTGERDVVEIAAVLGREFGYDLLAAVAGRDEPTLQSELSRLVVAELLYPKGQPPRCDYRFKHALLQEAAYLSLVKTRRQQHHRRVAQVLEAQFPQTAQAQPELLAHHWTEAGEAARATELWLEAGTKALGRWAHLEAIGHLERGLGELKTLGESLDRDGLELRFLKPLGMALMAAKGYASQEAGAVMKRARVLAERIGHPAQLFATMWGSWAWYVVGAQYPLCMTLSDEAMALSTKVGDPGIKMEALFMPGLTKYSRGDFQGALGHLEEALSRYDDRARTLHWASITGQDSGVAHRCYRALSLWNVGRPDQALAQMRELPALARAIGHPYTQAYVQHHAAWLYTHCRLGPEAMAAAEEGRRQADELGFELLRATSRIFRGSALLLRDRAQDAVPALKEGVALYRATGAEMALPFYYSLVAKAYLELGGFEEAGQALREAIRFMEKNDDRFAESALYRLRGELVLAETKDKARAEEEIRKALDVARCQRSRGMELEAAISLARMLPKDARAVLEPLASTFTEGRELPTLREAAELLRAT